jgi:hypothetical protein
VVEGARLESVYTATYRGFESLLLRHLHHSASLAEAFFLGNRIGGVRAQNSATEKVGGSEHGGRKTPIDKSPLRIRSSISSPLFCYGARPARVCRFWRTLGHAIVSKGPQL